MITMRIKDMFFDRHVVIAAVDNAKRKVLSKAGAFSVTGTFSSAAVSGLGTGGDAAERTATATEATAKNTKRLLDASVDNGLRFA